MHTDFPDVSETLLNYLWSALCKSLTENDRTENWGRRLYFIYYDGGETHFFMYIYILNLNWKLSTSFGFLELFTGMCRDWSGVTRAVRVNVTSLLIN